jgi:hypothetical protein
MRSVPSRASRYGFTPTNAPIEKRIGTLRSLSTLARNLGDRPLQKGWEQGIQSYADAAWGAVRVLQDAAAAQRKVTSVWTNITTDTPANAAPYDDAILKILNGLNPVVRAPETGVSGTWGDVFDKVPFILQEANWTVAKGSGAKLESARKSKDALLTRLTALRGELINAGGAPYLTRPVKPTETVKDAIARFKAPPAAPAPAASAPAVPAPAAPASTAPASAAPAAAASVDEEPASTALTQVTTESAQQGPSAPGAPAPGAPAPDAMPKWLLPALAVAGAAGVALVLLPMGSSNRGSRARNLDYGSVPSDAKEGRMLRGTLRNLESDAHAMRQMLRDDDDLPQWVHAKVQTSADRVSGAQRYLRAKIQAPK